MTIKLIINNSIHESIIELNEKCWSQESEKRPTFSDIVNDLKNISEYITKILILILIKIIYIILINKKM